MGNIKRFIPVRDDDRWILIATTVRQKTIPFTVQVQEPADEHVKKMVCDAETCRDVCAHVSDEDEEFSVDVLRAEIGKHNRGHLHIKVNE